MEVDRSPRTRWVQMRDLVSVYKVGSTVLASGLVHTCRLTPATHLKGKWANEKCIV